jgi:hypothetical protein
VKEAFEMGDSVDHDIRILGERNWRNLALNREEWRSFCRRPGLMQVCRADDDDDSGVAVILGEKNNSYNAQFKLSVISYVENTK